MAYVSLADLKQYLGIATATTTDDALLRRLISSAGKGIETYCGRKFEAWVETRYFSHDALDGDNSAILWLDEDGVSEVPTAVTWDLTDRFGTVINSRHDVAIAVPAATNDIVLAGADLTIGAGGPERVMLVEATYTSALGAGLLLKDECWFVIDALVAFP